MFLRTNTKAHIHIHTTWRRARSSEAQQINQSPHLDVSCLLDDIVIHELSWLDLIRDGAAHLQNRSGVVDVGSVRRFVHCEAEVDALSITDCTVVNDT